jgi:hypothetical protein
MTISGKQSSVSWVPKQSQNIELLLVNKKGTALGSSPKYKIILEEETRSPMPETSDSNSTPPALPVKKRRFKTGDDKAAAETGELPPAIPVKNRGLI